MAASLLVNYSLQVLSGRRQRGWSMQSLAARLTRTLSVSWVVEPKDEGTLRLLFNDLICLFFYDLFESVCTDTDHTCLSLCL